VTNDPAGWRYGLLGLPLAFVALPLYVQLPARYAVEFGVPLALLGALLLGARLLDAVLDPWIGRLVDRLFRHSTRGLLAASALAAAVLAAGFALRVFPPVRSLQPLLITTAALLVVTYVAFSVVTIAHQSWGARIGGDEAVRARVVGWREGMGLAGVLVASVLPTAGGWAATTASFALLLGAGWWAWSASQAPVPPASTKAEAWDGPFASPAFGRLLAVFVLNGTAAAVPATLLLFFVQDRLQAEARWQPAFLGTYFLCAALSLPAWLALVRRFGLARTWLAGMLLAAASFVGTAALGAGDGAIFIGICALCGVALGSDLALPAAMLAGVVERAGRRGRGEGAFFGWWNFASKLNLALAAGLALPLLQFAGYTPGTRDGDALRVLTFAYCVLPCLLKLGAAALLYFTWIRPEASP
jgi:GPH family glycoside/pentoside/hexuronide:cation symporter